MSKVAGHVKKRVLAIKQPRQEAPRMQSAPPPLRQGLRGGIGCVRHPSGPNTRVSPNDMIPNALHVLCLLSNNSHTAYS